MKALFSLLLSVSLISTQALADKSLTVRDFDGDGIDIKLVMNGPKIWFYSTDVIGSYAAGVENLIGSPTGYSIDALAEKLNTLSHASIEGPRISAEGMIVTGLLALSGAMSAGGSTQPAALTLVSLAGVACVGTVGVSLGRPVGEILNRRCHRRLADLLQSLNEAQDGTHARVTTFLLNQRAVDQLSVILKTL